MIFRSFVILLAFCSQTTARLQDYKETVGLAVIPHAKSPFWKISSECMVATAASHVTLAMAVPRSAIDADFVWSLTGRLGAITVMDARQTYIVGRYVVALIVDNYETLDTLLVNNPKLWWPIAYYVISAPDLQRDRYKSFSRSLWDRYRVRNTILVVESSDRVVATFNPFINTSHGGRLSIFKVKEFNFVVEDYSTVLNMHKIPLKVTIFPSIPTAIPQPDGTYIGYDGMLLRTIAQKMNFTPIISKPADGELFGERYSDGSYTGGLRDIIEDRADIIFNGYFIKDHRSDKLDFSTYITQNQVCFIVPKAGAMPRVITIFNCFQPKVWAFVIISYVVFTLVYYLWDDISNKKLRKYNTHKRSCVSLDSLKMFLNYAPNHFPQLDSGKVLAVSFIFMSFFVISQFQGIFLTFLNRPISYQDIDTLEELKESKISIRTTFLGIEYTLNQDPSLSSISRNIKLVTSTERVADAATSGTMSQEGGSGGMVRLDSFKAKYLMDFVKVNSSEPLHVVRECPLSYFLAYFVQRGSPFLDSFNTIIARCVTAGLVTKWSWDTNYATFREIRPYIRGENDEEIRAFCFSDLHLPFLLYLTGISLSIISFVTEILISLISRKLSEMRLRNNPLIYVNEFPTHLKMSKIIDRETGF